MWTPFSARKASRVTQRKRQSEMALNWYLRALEQRPILVKV
jgi:hypothetical protein